MLVSFTGFYWALGGFRGFTGFFINEMCSFPTDSMRARSIISNWEFWGKKEKEKENKKGNRKSIGRLVRVAGEDAPKNGQRPLLVALAQQVPGTSKFPIKRELTSIVGFP